MASFSIFHPNASSPISEAWNSTGRGGKQRPRVVDETQRPQRRRLGCKLRPKAKRIEKGDGAVEQGDGAASSAPLVGAA